MSNTMNYYEKKAKNTTDAQRAKALKLSDDTANTKISQTEEAYAKAIDTAKTAYESEYQKNAVSKLVNERAIAEKNANLGLTDSGLNRTQQTANQLWYSNQKGKLDLAKQTEVSALESNLAASISQIRQENEANKYSINQSYDQYNTQLANQMYNADVTAAQKAAQKATQEVTDKQSLFRYAGTDNKTGKMKYYDESGKAYFYDKGINPYTGTKNPDIAYGTFSNGYQPNNVGMITIGEQGHKEDVINTLSKTGDMMIVHGREVNVWVDKKGNYYYWDGPLGRYRGLEKTDGKYIEEQ